MVIYLPTVMGILLLACSVWIQVDFENYLIRHQYKYQLLGASHRISYTPAVLFAFRLNILGHYRDDALASRAVSYIGKFNGHQLKDAYLAHCYYDEIVKVKILSGDSSITQKLGNNYK